ncbi:MAG: heme-binding protein [Rhodovulum sp.]|nr:heme-binding protein [Rhodovulum sp.]
MHSQLREPCAGTGGGLAPRKGAADNAAPATQVHRHPDMYTATSKRLTNEGARKILESAFAQAREAGIQVAVAIVDGGGNMLLLERMDTARFHLVHSSTTKAVCAASNQRPTTSKGAVAQPLDVAHAIGLALAAGPHRWTAMEGGCPIIFDGECVGGVGVSGGSWEIDARIAEEAVKSIGAAISIDGK